MPTQITTSLLFRRISIKTILVVLNELKTGDYKKVWGNLDKLYTYLDDETEELNRAIHIQEQLYKIQSRLSKNTVTIEKEKLSLFSVCSFALSKLYDLYPAKISEEHAKYSTNQLIQLSSGHHARVERLIRKFKLSTLNVRDTETDNTLQLECHLPLSNPYVEQTTCTYREMIAVLAQGQKEGFALPSKLILLQIIDNSKNETADYIFIGNKEARKDFERLQAKGVSSSSSFHVLELEHVVFYNNLLKLYPHETLETLTKLDKVMASKHMSDMAQIVSILKPFVEYKAIYKKETTQLDIVSINQLQLNCMIESILVQDLINTQRTILQENAEAGPTEVEYENLSLKLYQTVCQIYMNSKEIFTLSDTELAELSSLVNDCIAFLNKQQRYALFLSDINELLQSKEYQALQTHLYDLCIAHVFHEKATFSIIAKPDPITRTFNEIYQDPALQEFIETHKKSFCDIEIDREDIYDSVDILLQNAQSSRFKALIKRGMVPFSLIAYFTDEHDHCLYGLLAALDKLSFETKKFLKSIKIKGDKPEDFHRVFFEHLFEESTSKAVAENLLQARMENLNSERVRNLIIHGMSFKAALTLTPETLKSLAQNHEERLPEYSPNSSENSLVQGLQDLKKKDSDAAARQITHRATRHNAGQNSGPSIFFSRSIPVPDNTAITVRKSPHHRR